MVTKEVKHHKLNISPNQLLAQAEQAIIEDDFKSNFKQRLQSKISDIAFAIAHRNK